MVLRTIRWFVTAGVVLACGATLADAQTKEVWPEVSTFIKLTDQMRLYFLATKVEESGEATGSELGPNVDFYLKPIRDRKHWGGFQLDTSKNRFLTLRLGYRYLPAFNGAEDENRGVVELTARYPLIGGALVSNRARADLRFIDGEFSWRYRDRISVEKEFSVGKLRLNPYIRGEIYYDSRFKDWTRTEAIAGSAFPINKRWEFESYLDYQLDTGNAPNSKLYAVGAVLNIYFR